MVCCKITTIFEVKFGDTEPIEVKFGDTKTGDFNVSEVLNQPLLQPVFYLDFFRLMIKSFEIFINVCLCELYFMPLSRLIESNLSILSQLIKCAE